MSVNTYLNERERRILESAVVGIAGAGGLGSNCAMHLVRAGVKKLVIADFDVVGESNLNRQFFFRDQLGRKKVDALAENLRRIEPDLSLDLRDVRLAPDNIDWTFSGCSFRRAPERELPDPKRHGAGAWRRLSDDMGFVSQHTRGFRFDGTVFDAP